MTTHPGPSTQPSLLSDAETEAIRPGSTRPWNPSAALRYLTGLRDREWHAVPVPASRRLTQPGDPPEARAACGKTVTVTASHGTYDRLSPPVARHPCRPCAWQLAIETGSTGRELALITPGEADSIAITRSGADPALATRIILAILRDAQDEDDDLDSPVVPQLLALAASHRPALYYGEACADGDCEDHSAACAEVGCGTCTPHAGPWAGEREGDALSGLIVPAPCSVLTTLAARYEIPVR